MSGFLVHFFLESTRRYALEIQEKNKQRNKKQGKGSINQWFKFRRPAVIRVKMSAVKSLKRI